MLFLKLIDLLDDSWVFLKNAAKKPIGKKKTLYASDREQNRVYRCLTYQDKSMESDTNYEEKNTELLLLENSNRTK
jgi:hypothetical protein